MKRKTRLKSKYIRRRIILFCLILLVVFGLWSLIRGIQANAAQNDGGANTFSDNSLEKSEYSDIVICIDPGHSIDDSGAVPPESFDIETDENKQNLLYGEAIRDILIKKGFKVVMTRDSKHEKAEDGSSVDLDDRARVSMESESDVFISLHFNYFDDEGIYGTIIYTQENSESDNSKREKLSEMISDRISFDIPQKVSKRTYKDDNAYYLTREGVTHGTSALIEIGFFSNFDECENIVSSKWRQKMATAISEGIIDFVDYYKFDI